MSIQRMQRLLHSELRCIALGHSDPTRRIEPVLIGDENEVG
jgi:hypothetical protein